MVGVKYTAGGNGKKPQTFLNGHVAYLAHAQCLQHAQIQEAVSAVCLEVPVSLLMVHLSQTDWPQVPPRRIIPKVPGLTKSLPAKTTFTFQQC